MGIERKKKEQHATAPKQKKQKKSAHIPVPYYVPEKRTKHKTKTTCDKKDDRIIKLLSYLTNTYDMPGKKQEQKRKQRNEKNVRSNN